MVLASRAKHASQQVVSGSFCGSYALVFACFALRHASLAFPWGGGGKGTLTLGMLPWGCEDTVACRQLLSKVGWGGGWGGAFHRRQPGEDGEGGAMGRGV